jgi:uncharacterized protein
MPKSPPVTLAGTATHRLKSAHLDDELRIEVSLPLEYDDTTRQYPVVYLLDGYWYFPLVSQALRLLEMDEELQPVIVVGIGYEPGELSHAQENVRVTHLRCRDLTPTLDPSDWWRAAAGRPLGIGVETGHADEFLRVIETEIKPLVARHYRASRAGGTLAGFSFGGLFALHVLFRHTELFDRYVAGSPSLWWDGGVMFESEAEYAATHPDLEKALFLSMGGLEEGGIAAPCRMVTHFELLRQRLASRNYPSLRWRATILEGETHSSGVASSFIKGLQAVLTGRDEDAR